MERRARLKRLARAREQRWRAFGMRQANLTLVFVLLLCWFSLTTSMRANRLLWEKPRSSDWWEQVVLSTFTSEDWLSNFRMSRSTFSYLCEKLSCIVARSDTVMRRAIPVEKRVAMTLWFLATGADYRTIGHLFGVSKSSVCLVTKEVCSSIVSQLLPQFVRFPTGSALTEVVEGYKNELGFPQCVGAVDGCHIPIVSPQDCPADYYNRKGWHSIILQGTVDFRGWFTDIYVGWPGRVHDARVFANSSLYSRGQQNTLFTPNTSVSLSGADVPLVLLGDPAYPLLPWLMKAYVNNGHLTTQKKLFNYRLSKARVVVEHTYGRLKGRWRCLLKRLDIDVGDVSQVVTACCVLHNICEAKGELFNDDWTEGVDVDDTVSSSSPAQPCSDSIAIRDAFTQYFSQ